MKYFPLFLALLLSSAGLCQTYTLAPKWKVGEKKELTITRTTTKSGSGQPSDPETETEKIQLEVTGEDEMSYTMKLQVQNPIFIGLQDIDESLPQKLSDHRQLTLVQKIQKKTGKIEIVNWAELQSGMKQTLDIVEKHLTGENNEMASYLNLVIAPLSKTFEDQENYLKEFSKSTGNIFSLYGTTITAGDSVITTESTPNPMVESAPPLEVKKVMWISGKDDSSGKLEVSVENRMDMAAMKEMFLMMVESMAEAFGGGEKAKEELQEMRDMNMLVENHEVYSYNIISSWPEKVQVTVTINLSLGSKREEITQNVISVTLK